MNVLIIVGHPRKGSFSHALAYAYEKGAQRAGVNIKTVELGTLRFNPSVVTTPMHLQYCEPDIEQARVDIAWADHLVFVYPVWWGTMPALLKGFLDRVLISGFAFEERAQKLEWKKLLKGKSAQLIMTMDTPKWVYRWIYNAPGWNAMVKGTLGYCGIKPVRIMTCSMVKYADTRLLNYWLERAKRAGFRLEKGVLTRCEILFQCMGSWLKAVRFQFYPMAWVAYSVGAYLAISDGNGLDWPIFWTGYLFLLFLEIATVFSNDYYDYPSDVRNENYSQFTGGSRVIVEKQISPSALKKGAIFSFMGACIAGIVVFLLSPGEFPVKLSLMIVLTILALGYTAPPLKLSYRGLGELDVGLTHSIGVLLCGFVFQGGVMSNPIPWLVSIPLLLAILPAIILAGLPDYDADKSIGKKTLAVQLGKRNAARTAFILILLSMLVSLFLTTLSATAGLYDTVVFIAIPHGVILLVLIRRYLQQKELPARIDSLMAFALFYIFWFGIFPLFALL